VTGRETVDVRVDAACADVDEASSIAPQIPLASTLAPGTRVRVLPTAIREGGALQRLFRGATLAVPTHARCTALLVRGYVDITVDGDDVWGATASS
jgi:hypothetical protein